MSTLDIARGKETKRFSIRADQLDSPEWEVGGVEASLDEPQENASEEEVAEVEEMAGVDQEEADESEVRDVERDV